ncbi:hypothetical protein [Tsukamurella paurometabola]|uniref:Uncharacterized protein n=1 Tax=Tsukamurella paurometabola TaxID=2061 RepID=A0A3P8MCE1_TSUPA|nr:hypothetical protein [Tsukamurella paurometabola]MBS4100957.1 hypothetical protein [Tsukamurella paurometabola]UEA83345.1 hypothetical protein LK411_00340 [Tsukamurella paurometabola]VDR40450.1 Uncharacterised protein [Tsukamurella paurometabola]
MSWIIVVLLAVVVLAVLAATGFAIALVRNSRRQQRAEAAMPFPSRAPLSWSGSHVPEARLHRRIRTALRAFDQPAGVLSAAQLDAQVRLTVAAQELDDRLVTIAALPESEKAAAIEAAAADVADLEKSIADTVVVRPPLPPTTT